MIFDYYKDMDESAHGSPNHRNASHDSVWANPNPNPIAPQIEGHDPPFWDHGHVHVRILPLYPILRLRASHSQQLWPRHLPCTNNNHNKFNLFSYQNIISILLLFIVNHVLYLFKNYFVRGRQYFFI